MNTTNILHCVPEPGNPHPCDKPARWHVWFVGYPLYTNMCDKHAARVMVNDQDGWPVACVKLVSQTFLLDTDRSMPFFKQQDE